MRYRYHDAIDAEPFCRWVEEQFEDCGGVVSVCAARLGVDDASVKRWMARQRSDGQPLTEIRETTADAALTHAGWTLAMIYPNEANDSVDGWCPTCRERTITGPDLICLWCDTSVAVNRYLCPGCGGSKWRDAARCHRCANGGRKTAMHISEHLLHLAYRLYSERGLSAPEVAARILSRTGYSSVESCEACLRASWKVRGWALRTPGETHVLLHRRRAPRCKHIGHRGRAKGRRCDRRADPANANGYCCKHDPEAMARRLAVWNAQRRPA